MTATSIGLVLGCSVGLVVAYEQVRRVMVESAKDRSPFMAASAPLYWQGHPRWEGTYAGVPVELDTYGCPPSYIVNRNCKGRVVILGDSVAWGYSLPGNEQIHYLLASEFGFSSYSLSAPGWTMQQVVDAARRRKDLLDSVQYVVYLSSPNDVFPTTGTVGTESWALARAFVPRRSYLLADLILLWVRIRTSGLDLVDWWAKRLGTRERVQDSLEELRRLLGSKLLVAPLSIPMGREATSLIREVSLGLGIRTVFLPRLSEGQMLDACHPNPEGARLIAAVIGQCLGAECDAAEERGLHRRHPSRAGLGDG